MLFFIFFLQFLFFILRKIIKVEIRIRLVINRLFWLPSKQEGKKTSAKKIALPWFSSSSGQMQELLEVRTAARGTWVPSKNKNKNKRIVQKQKQKEKSSTTMINAQDSFGG
jgi:hypothetical protein